MLMALPARKIAEDIRLTVLVGCVRVDIVAGAILNVLRDIVVKRKLILVRVTVAVVELL